MTARNDIFRRENNKGVIEMGHFEQEIVLSAKETTVLRWKGERSKTRFGAIGMIFLGLFGTALTTEADRTLRIILWIICIAAIIALAVVEYTLNRMIAQGEKEIYAESLEVIKSKKKLEELGIASFNADFDRQQLILAEPEGKEPFALALYLIVLGICFGFLIYLLLP